MRCSMVWDLLRTKKEKPAAGKTGYWRTFWRKRWDSNPRAVSSKLISSKWECVPYRPGSYLKKADFGVFLRDCTQVVRNLRENCGMAARQMAVWNAAVSYLCSTVSSDTKRNLVSQVPSDIVLLSPSSILVRSSRNSVIIIFLQANTEVRVPLQ